jgi:hypothetical protein
MAASNQPHQGAWLGLVGSSNAPHQGAWLGSFDDEEGEAVAGSLPAMNGDLTRKVTYHRSVDGEI